MGNWKMKKRDRAYTLGHVSVYAPLAPLFCGLISALVSENLITQKNRIDRRIFILGSR
jgi:hypothetical protein